MVRDEKDGRVETRKKNKREGEPELEGEKAELDGTAVATVFFRLCTIDLRQISYTVRDYC